MAHVSKPDPLQQLLGRLGLGPHLADLIARFRRQQRHEDLLPREQGGDKLLGVLAEEVRLGEAEVDEPAAEVVPEEVPAVRRQRPHHLRDDPLREPLGMPPHEVEADEAQEHAESLVVAPIGGAEHETADLARSRLVRGELQGEMDLAGLKILAVVLALADLEEGVGPPRPAQARDDRGGPDHVARVRVLQDEEELALAGAVRLSREALSGARDLLSNDVRVRRQVDEVHHLGQLEKRGRIVDGGVAD